MKVAPNSGGGGAGGGGSNRNPDTDDKVLLAIASKQSVLLQQLITLTCYIPSASVGAVIGRKGATVDKIQNKAQQAGTSHGPVRLSIVGNQSELAAAASSSSAIMGDDSQPNNNSNNNNSSTEASSPEHSPLQSTQQNATASTPLQATASASSSSVPYTYTQLDFSDANWTPVVIRSDPCATLTAAQLLKEKVGRMDDVIMDIPLGRNKHAAVVGRRGFILGNLSADFNVRIMIPRKELRHDLIQLEGELDNVKQCFDRILEISNEVPGGKKKASGGGTNNNSSSNNNSNSNAGNNNTGNGSKQQQDKKDEEESETVTLSALPPQTKLKTIGKKTETAIKKKKTEDGSWDLTVFGATAENVKEAVALLKKLNESTTGKGDNASGTPTNSGGGTPTRARGRGRQRNNKSKGGNNKQKSGKSVESPS